MTPPHSIKRSFVVLAAVCLAIAITNRGGSQAANLVTLTPLASLTGLGPIGIDWFPGGTAPNQLLISDHYDGDFNHQGNFAIVDKTTGSIATQLANPFGYTNEIYFASVRPGSPSAGAGWPVNHVFYAEGGDTGPDGALDPQCIGEMDGGGVVLNQCRFSIPGETRIKRGGVRFDYAGIAGGDLIVVASNDNDDENSTVYRINLAGTVTTVLTYTGVDDTGKHVHWEGIATVPANSAYGDWSGKILVGAERYSSAGGQGAVFAIDPNCANLCAPTITQLDTPTEDIWVVPANSSFYGVDYAEGGQLAPQRLWRGGPEQWTNYVGKILLAKEHGAQLYIVDGVSHTVTKIYDGFVGESNPQNAIQWEHTTFVPEVVSRAKISIAPNATNEVGQPHTFTVTLQKDTGSGFVPAAGEHVDVTLTDSNGAFHTAPTGTCTNAGPNTDAAGQCTITFTSNSAGKVTGHASATLNLGTPIFVETDGVPPNSGNAVKRFVDANIQITPSGTNPVGATHTFTGHVNVNTGNGAGFVNAPNGTQISFTIDSGPGGFTSANPCTTAGGTGSCTITLVSATPGTTTVSAHTTVMVATVSLTRQTNGSGGNSGPAIKRWADDVVTTRVLDAANNDITGAPRVRAQLGRLRITGRQAADTSVTVPVPAGTVVHDEASVTKAPGTPAAVPSPTGTVTFTLYDNATCNGTVVMTDPNKPLNASGVAVSANFTVPASGSFSYLAHYNGDANYPAHDAACEPFTVRQGGLITDTNVACSDVLSGNAQNFVIPGLNYPGTTTIGQGIDPGKFFYWAQITTSVPNQVVIVSQSNNSTNNEPPILIHQGWERIYTSNCASYQTGTEIFGGAGTSFTVATPGSYIIGVKYDPKSLVGKPVPVPSVITYTFTTSSGGSTSATVKLQPK
jgi:hypothetical protein